MHGHRIILPKYVLRSIKMRFRTMFIAILIWPIKQTIFWMQWGDMAYLYKMKIFWMAIK